MWCCTFLQMRREVQQPSRTGGHRLQTALRRGKPSLEALEGRTLLSRFTVDALTDTGEGSGLTGDLRYALTQAGSGDTVLFAVSGTIGLTSPLPDLRGSLTIEGPGPGSLTVERVSGGDYGVFAVADGAVVSLSGLTIANGMADYPDLGGGVYNPAGSVLTLSNCVISCNHVTDIGFNVPRDNGGGVWNGGTLIVSDSIFSGNYAGVQGALWGNGGGLSNFGTATITRSTFSGNGAEVGAGMYNQGTLTVDGCTVSDNPGDTGGGIANYMGELTVTSSTLAGNSADLGQGGGIFNSYGAVDIRNSTLTANSARWAGGIWSNWTLTVSNSTISGNTAHLFSSAGGIASYATYHDTTVQLLNCTISDNTVESSDRTGSQLFSSGSATAKATVLLRNTIVSGSGARPNYFATNGGTFISLGHNLNSDGSGNQAADGDLPNTSPLLGPLQDNGGPTPTMSLLPGSPAVDAGDNSHAPDFDQRGPGFERIVGGQIDLGAFEAQVGAAARLAVSAPAGVTSGTPFDVSVTAVDAYGHKVAGYSGTVSFRSTDLDPGVVLPADYTFTADDQGVHTFAAGFMLLSPGDQSVTATDAVGSAIASGVSVTVDPGGNSPAPGRAPGSFFLGLDRPASATVVPSRLQGLGTAHASVPSLGVKANLEVAALDWFFASLGRDRD